PGERGERRERDQQRLRRTPARGAARRPQRDEHRDRERSNDGDGETHGAPPFGSASSAARRPRASRRIGSGPNSAHVKSARTSAGGQASAPSTHATPRAYRATTSFRLPGGPRLTTSLARARTASRSACAAAASRDRAACSSAATMYNESHAKRSSA